MLQQGSLFDNRYELARFIGRGGFAEVWLVRDSLTGLEEALKIYAPGSGLDEDGMNLFVKELSVVHDLRHTNLLTPKTLGQYEHQPYLLLPYCPNGSLNKKIGQCSEDEAWKILEQVASGLAYLHKRKIVHQDIKPDNILVDANMDYVITDFGISLRVQSTLRKSMREQANSGTMAYMAPERFSKEPHPIPANDIWSLGAMMFEIIEGEVPFLPQLGGLAQMNGAQIPTMHSAVSTSLKQVILSMLASNTTDRPTATQVVEMVKKKGIADARAEQTPQTESRSSAKVRDDRETQRIDAEKIFSANNDVGVAESESVVDASKNKPTSSIQSEDNKTQRITPSQFVDPKQSESSTPQRRFCRKCGTQLSPNARFCKKCGTKID